MYNVDMIIIGCDFNKDMSNDDNIKSQLQSIKMKIVQNLNDSHLKLETRNKN